MGVTAAVIAGSVGALAGAVDAKQERDDKKALGAKLDEKESFIQGMFEDLMSNIDPSFDKYRGFLEQGLQSIMDYGGFQRDALGDAKGSLAQGQDAIRQAGSDARGAISAGADQARGDARMIGAGARDQINERAAQMQGAALAAGAGSGRLGGSYTGNLMRGVMGDANRAHVDLDSQLAGVYAGISEREGAGLASSFTNEGAGVSGLFQNMAGIDQLIGQSFGNQGMAMAGQGNLLGSSFLDQYQFHSAGVTDLASILQKTPIFGKGPSIAGGALGGLSGSLSALAGGGFFNKEA